ncbi:diacylglycerol kinase, partial [Streptomyces sp. JJ36]|nr:diacylglycerol kinase [Streptomyces sp. JJ36]
MSAPDLLVVIDPVARATDGESVRIARDVLCAGAPGVKLCVLREPADTARALAKRGGRRPVVVGDDRALLRTVQVLHRERELAGCPVAVVPVGPPERTVLARSLGVPGTAVAASRVALGGTERARDLLIDDSGGVVLGDLRVPATGGAPGAARADGPRPGAPADGARRDAG